MTNHSKTLATQQLDLPGGGAKMPDLMVYGLLQQLAASLGV